MGIDTRAAQGERTGVQVKPIVIGLIALFLTGVALTLQVRNWYALGVEAGGSCGSGRGGISYGPCPRGLTPMLLLSFFGLFIFVPTALIAFRSQVKGRVGCLIMVAAIALGVYPGLAIFTWWHGETLDQAWSLPGEVSRTSERAEGSWATGGMIVRARFDGLNAYDATKGNRRWSYAVPGQNVLCSMSRSAEGGVGLVGHGPEGKPCETIVAVELATGRQLWSQTLTGLDDSSGSLSASADPDTVDIAGEVAVLRVPGGLKAVALRTGEQRWVQRAAERTEFVLVGGATNQIVTLVRHYDGNTTSVRTLDPGTGRQRWEATLPGGTNAYNTELISTSPVVLYLQGSGKRGRDSLLVFDDAGRVRTTIDAADLDGNARGFAAAPVRHLFVRGDTLVAAGAPVSGKYKVYGYSLTDGRRLWTKDVGRHTITAMQLDGDQVVLVTTRSTLSELRRLTLRDGKQPDGTQIVGMRRVSNRLALYVTPNRYVFVEEDGSAPFYRPITAVERK